ncbi:MAG: transglycosylase SLT domain-containing protein [Helicobacteraceae bacterium]|nr:transglycosylase SLT domain-containing protein [Helicobacteraceae bacterium]
MIWQYFKQDITPSQADKAFYQLENVNFKLFNAYTKKTDDKTFKYVKECRGISSKKLLSNKDDDCVWLGLGAYKVSKLSFKDRKLLYKRFKDNKDLYWLKISTEKNIKKNYKKYSPRAFLYWFNSAGTANRVKNFNFHISKEYLNRLSSTSGFSTFVKKVTTNKKLSKIQQSLFNVKSDKLNAQTNFFLAINALKYHYKTRSKHYLALTYKKSYYRMDKDKAKFWMYQIKKEKKYLQELAESVDINIYSLYAKEKLKKRVDNYFIKLDVDKKATSHDIEDPFVWNKILKEIKATPKANLKKLAKHYSHPSLIPVKSFILERESSYTNHNYIMPYKDAMKEFSKDDVALMLSLMRQESRFIPASLSRSYALGVMQIMPFLAKILDKKQDNPMKSLSDMFDADRNIAYAYKHVKWIKSSLYHPLFIAYAYNGGMGFTKRHLQTGAFSKHEKYEPFISMELMSNTESREYGKKVLANYVIYKQILGEDISINSLFEKLKKPSSCHRFDI